MKKILSLVFALFVCSAAQSENYIGLSYSLLSYSPDDLDIDIDGYELSFASVEDNVAWKAGYGTTDATYDDVSVSLDGAYLGWAIGKDSFASGTVYTAADVLFTNYGSETSLSIGYAKRNADELSYDLAVSFSDGQSTLGAGVRFPLSHGGGVEIGVSDSDSLRVLSIGYSYSF